MAADRPAVTMFRGRASATRPTLGARGGEHRASTKPVRAAASLAELRPSSSPSRSSSAEHKEDEDPGPGVQVDISLQQQAASYLVGAKAKLAHLMVGSRLPGSEQQREEPEVAKEEEKRNFAVILETSFVSVNYDLLRDAAWLSLFTILKAR